MTAANRVRFFSEFLVWFFEFNRFGGQRHSAHACSSIPNCQQTKREEKEAFTNRIQRSSLRTSVYLLAYQIFEDRDHSLHTHLHTRIIELNVCTFSLSRFSISISVLIFDMVKYTPKFQRKCCNISRVFLEFFLCSLLLFPSLRLIWLRRHFSCTGLFPFHVCICYWWPFLEKRKPKASTNYTNVLRHVNSLVFARAYVCACGQVVASSSFKA